MVFILIWIMFEENCPLPAIAISYTWRGLKSWMYLSQSVNTQKKYLQPICMVSIHIGEKSYCATTRRGHYETSSRITLMHNRTTVHQECVINNLVNCTNLNLANRSHIWIDYFINLWNTSKESWLFVYSVPRSRAKPLCEYAFGIIWCADLEINSFCK